MRYTRNWKAKKGLIRVTLDLEGNTIKDIHISGDFFMFPENSINDLEGNTIKDIRISGDFFMFPENSINDLEDMLKGSDVNSVAEIVKKFYQRGITTPGVDPEDFVKALTVI